MKTCTNPYHGRASRKHYANGLCEACYKRLRDRGTLEPGQGLHKKCSLDGCDKPHVARGYCKPHWRAWKLYGDPRKLRSWGRATCSYPGCNADHRAMGLCNKHLHIRYWILSETEANDKKISVEPLLPYLRALADAGKRMHVTKKEDAPIEANDDNLMRLAARLAAMSEFDVRSWHRRFCRYLSGEWRRIKTGDADLIAHALGTHPAILWPDEWITEVAA